MKPARLRRTVVRSLAAVTLAALAWIGTRLATHNFGTVLPERVYRSGQMDPATLGRTIRTLKIRTVLNLRGANPETTWYAAERAATLSAGATQVDFPMSSDQWLSRDQARTLVDTLETCSYPLLIHCEWGAERTGLVAAIVALLQPGGSPAQARRQFSWRFLFVDAGDGRVMIGHLRRYEAWLGDHHLAHSPERFRRWLTESYVPGSPSREYWPWNPYPLRTVSRPPGTDRPAQR